MDLPMPRIQQERTVTGRCTTAVDDAPLAGVTVMVRTPPRGGNFGLGWPPTLFRLQTVETLVFPVYLFCID